MLVTPRRAGVTITAVQTATRPGASGPADGVRLAARPAALRAGAGAIIRYTPAGHGVRLHTTPAAEVQIAAGAHQIRDVDGRRLAYPSQHLAAIESTRPHEHGQTHCLTEHVGNDLAANVRRLDAEPQIRAAGGYLNEAAAQRATDRTIADPHNQQTIGTFLADPERTKIALEPVDLGETVGTTTLRSDLDAGRPSLIPNRSATVVLIKDPSFPEGYRILTSYPDSRSPAPGART